MGIRESLKDRPKALSTVAVVVIVGAVVYIAQGFRSGSSTTPVKAYYTTDEGATQFVDSMDHLAPFDHEGKPAYRVWMFSTDGGKTKFPGYLERYTTAAKARIEPEILDFRSGKRHMPPDTGPADSEVKKIGVGNPWVSRANVVGAQKITQVKGDSNADVQLQLPD